MDQVRPVVVFDYCGRFGHFLRAEASASALSYPVPPRTVLLGVIGAVLGLEKDTPQDLIGDARIAVSGKNPRTHWHRAKFRKDPPTALPMRIKVRAKGSDKPERATLIKQEWLIKPHYRVTASLPEPFHEQLVERLKTRAWHYCPSLGLSEMIAELKFIAEGTAHPLEAQSVQCQSVVAQDNAELDGQQFVKNSLEIQIVRMPRAVTSERVFSHANYLVERRGRPIPVETSAAFRLSGEMLEGAQVMFL